MGEEVAIAQWDFGGQREGDLPFKRHCCTGESICSVLYCSIVVTGILMRSVSVALFRFAFFVFVKRNCSKLCE